VAVSTTAEQPVHKDYKKYVRPGKSVTFELNQTNNNVSGTWALEVTSGKGFIETPKIKDASANKTSFDVKGVKAGTAKITAKFTGNGKTVEAQYIVVVKGAAVGKVIVGRTTGIKYKVLTTSTVAVFSTTQVARASKTAVDIPDVVYISDNGERINKTDSYNGAANYRTSYKVVKVMARALYKMDKVKKITIGNNVTEIGDHAFCDDKVLSELTIGTGLKKLGAQVVHQNVPKLKVITIKSTKVTSVANSLKGNKYVTTIKVPAAKVSAYETLFKKSGKTVTVTKL
jgi:hypothetical protein